VTPSALLLASPCAAVPTTAPINSSTTNMFQLHDLPAARAAMFLEYPFVQVPGVVFEHLFKGLLKQVVFIPLRQELFTPAEGGPNFEVHRFRGVSLAAPK
jgi:hypothetical protein